MNIQFYAKNTELTEELKEYAKKKILKTLKFYSKVQEIRIEFEEDCHHANGEKTKKIAVFLYVPRDVLVAEEFSNDFKTAIDLITPKLKMQVNKYKEKQETIIRRNGRKFKQAIQLLTRKALPWAVKEQYIPKYEIVKRKEFNIVEAIDTNKAIEEMNKLGHSFYAFADAESGKNTIVYKRKDGKYGIIKLNS